MIQAVHQTREEKIKMYRKMKKKDLAEMLVNCNEHIDALTRALNKGEGPTTDTVIWNPTNPTNPPYTLTCAMN